jgi:hypothetical protein
MHNEPNPIRKNEPRKDIPILVAKNSFRLGGACLLYISIPLVTRSNRLAKQKTVIAVTRSFVAIGIDFSPVIMKPIPTGKIIEAI